MIEAKNGKKERAFPRDMPKMAHESREFFDDFFRFVKKSQSDSILVCNTNIVCYIYKIPEKPYEAYLRGYFHSCADKAVYDECNTLYN